MKRLIKNRELVKLSDAARLYSLNLDADQAISAIESADPHFNKDKIIKDVGADRFAYWGAISDDGLYLMESYMYNAPGNEKKCAFVIAEINDGDIGNILDVIIKPISGGLEIRQTVINNGITLNSGEKINFMNEYTSIDQVDAKEDIEQV